MTTTPIANDRGLCAECGTSPITLAGAAVCAECAFEMDGTVQPSVPRRICLRRTKGWKMPRNTVKVDRSTVWGNPIVIGVAAHNGVLLTPAECVAEFRKLVLGESRLYPSLADIRLELRGKNLGCWCREGDPCHASVLLEIANS